MKKLHLYPLTFILLISSYLATGQKYKLKFIPASNSLSFEWLQDYINNNKDGITVLKNCDTSSTIKYAGADTFIVLRKKNRAILLFNLDGGSFIYPAHALPRVKNYFDYYQKLLAKISSATSDGPPPFGIVPLNATYFFYERKKL